MGLFGVEVGGNASPKLPPLSTDGTRFVYVTYELARGEFTGRSSWARVIKGRNIQCSGGWWRENSPTKVEDRLNGWTATKKKSRPFLSVRALLWEKIVLISASSNPPTRQLQTANKHSCVASICTGPLNLVAPKYCDMTYSCKYSQEKWWASHLGMTGVGSSSQLRECTVPPLWSHSRCIKRPKTTTSTGECDVVGFSL